MKKLPLLLLLGFALSCQNDDVINLKKGFIQFSFPDNSGGKVEEGEPAAVLISLEDTNGIVIEQDKKLPLYSFGSGYVSESLELSTGNYKLTKFMVLDADNAVIYATPVEGSPLAYLVNDPLPVAFAVTEDGTTLVIPQVLAVTDNNTPENFGYVNFGFEVVTTSSKIGEVVYYNYQYGSYSKTNKTIYHYENDRLIKKQFYHYLPEYWAFVLIHDEIYNYENDKLSTIDVASVNPNVPIETAYFFQYEGNQIILDVYNSDYLIHHYESTIEEYAATFFDTYTFSTDPALAEVYRLEAILDGNGNLVTLIEYDKYGVQQIEATFSGYIETINPLQEKVRYPALYDPLTFNNNLNTQVHFKNLSTGTIIVNREYSFEFDSNQRPKTIFVKNNGVNTSKMELVYTN
jgi:hypothetical protein